MHAVRLAIGETVILLALSLSIPIETPAEGRGGCSRRTVSSMARFDAAKNGLVDAHAFYDAVCGELNPVRRAAVGGAWYRTVLYQGCLCLVVGNTFPLPSWLRHCLCCADLQGSGRGGGEQQRRGRGGCGCCRQRAGRGGSPGVPRGAGETARKGGLFLVLKAVPFFSKTPPFLAVLAAPAGCGGAAGGGGCGGGVGRDVHLRRRGPGVAGRFRAVRDQRDDMQVDQTV